MAKNYGINLELVKGSGKNGIVTKEDLISYIE